MKPFDPTKPVQTIEGKKAVIYRVFSQEGSIHGAIEYQDTWLVRSWFINGKIKHGDCSFDDLENIPQKIKFEFLVNLYQDGNIGSVHRIEKDTIKSLNGFSSYNNKGISKKFEIEVDESEFGSQDPVPTTPVPQKIIRWTNITKSHGEYVAVGIYHSKQDAIDHAYNNNEQIKIEFDEF